MCYSGLIGLHRCYGSGHVPHTGLGSVQLGVLTSNSEGIVGKLDTHQFDKSWLNEFALKNIPPILVIFETFQLFNGWLNEFALKNIPPILVIFETFQLFNGWLNEFALKNIPPILVALDTFQLFNG